MLLDLRGIIEIPGGKITFDYQPDLSSLIGGSITKINTPVKAAGYVQNTAGILTFICDIEISLTCTCARCLKEFEYLLNKTVKANLTQHGDGEDPDGYFIQSDTIDASEIITSELLLNIDSRMLCNETCAGLCQKCGADLNKGKCSCPKETDSRWDALKELIE